MRNLDRTVISRLTPHHARRLADLRSAARIADDIDDTITDLRLQEVNSAIQTVRAGGRWPIMLADEGSASL